MNDAHVLQLTLTPAGMREPKLSEGTMMARMCMVPEIMRDNIAAATILTRNGYKLTRALVDRDYSETIRGLVIPRATGSRWDGFQQSELLQIEAALLEQRYWSSTALSDEVGRAIADRRG